MADELSAFLAKPNAENFRSVRELIVQSGEYDMLSEGDGRLEDLLAAGDYAAASELADDLMPNWFLSARVHRMAAAAAAALGDDEGAARERYIARACMQGLLLAGDGTAQKPYPVLHVSDEYDLLDALDKAATGQRTADLAGGRCDVLLCADGSELWFEVAPGFENAAVKQS